MAMLARCLPCASGRPVSPCVGGHRIGAERRALPLSISLHGGTGMKWCRFQIGNNSSYGIVEDEARVIEVSGTPFETYP